MKLCLYGTKLYHILQSVTCVSHISPLLCATFMVNSTVASYVQLIFIEKKVERLIFLSSTTFNSLSYYAYH